MGHFTSGVQRSSLGSSFGRGNYVTRASDTEVVDPEDEVKWRLKARFWRSFVTWVLNRFPRLLQTIRSRGAREIGLDVVLPRRKVARYAEKDIIVFAFCTAKTRNSSASINRLWFFPLLIARQIHTDWYQIEVSNERTLYWTIKLSTFLIKKKNVNTFKLLEKKFLSPNSKHNIL